MLYVTLRREERLVVCGIRAVGSKARGCFFVEGLRAVDVRRLPDGCLVRGVGYGHSPGAIGHATFSVYCCVGCVTRGRVRLARICRLSCRGRARRFIRFLC